MATAFSNKERDLIKGRLKDVAEECLLKYGVKRTTVDKIVKMAGISKGSFYNFYPTKETLFFLVLEEYQKSIVDELENSFEEKENMGVEEFTNEIYRVFQNLRKSFLMNIIRKQEIKYLMRKLPKKLIKSHHTLDNMLIEKLLGHIKTKNIINTDIIAASLRAIFMGIIYEKEIGEKNFDETLRLLIRGLAIQVVEEDYRDDRSH